MHDELGNRMKEQYENRTRHYLPRRTYTILRIDGKCFHKYTQHMKKPFDQELIDDFNFTAGDMLSEVQGAKFAYLQSDEASFLLTDFDDIRTDAWFDGNIQKMCSVAASTFTARFIQWRSSTAADHIPTDENLNAIDGFCYVSNEVQGPVFDARVFTIPDKNEVANYFVWRAQDAMRNSIQMVARTLYSHKECHDKNCNELQEMIFQKGINWNDYNPIYKRGRMIVKEPYEAPASDGMMIHRPWSVREIPQNNLFEHYIKLIP